MQSSIKYGRQKQKLLTKYRGRERRRVENPYHKAATQIVKHALNEGVNTIVLEDLTNIVMDAFKRLTRVYKQNPNLGRKIYSGLKIDFPSVYYENGFGEYGYKGDSEELKDRAALELIAAIQASEFIVPTPEVVGELSFGHNPISDKLYGMLMQLDRKRFPEITIES